MTVGLLAACGGDAGSTAQTPVAPATSPPQVPSSPSAPALTGRPAGEAACRGLRTAVTGDTLIQVGVVKAIVSDAGRSTMPLLMAAAGRLTSSYELYVKEKDKPTGAARAETLKGKGTDMLRTCRTEGLLTD